MTDRQEKRDVDSGCRVGPLFFPDMPARLLATFSFCVPTVPLSPAPEYGCPCSLKHSGFSPASPLFPLLLLLLCVSDSGLNFLTFPRHLMSFSGRVRNFTLQCIVTLYFFSCTYTYLHCHTNSMIIFLCVNELYIASQGRCDTLHNLLSVLCLLRHSHFPRWISQLRRPPPPLSSSF